MAKLYPLKWGDIDVQIFRAGGKGGQHQNKTETGVRLIHRPTGARVECRNERSQHENKEQGFALLQAKLDRLVRERHLAKRREEYQGKPVACFSSQVRTVRLCGRDQGVVDHRTGHFHSNPTQYLKGDIGGFIRESLLQRRD
jgi:peptide chain release factor 2